MKKTLILAACMMLLAACSQNTSLSISSDIASYRFDADGGAFDAIIFTNGSWTATCEDETVSLTPSAGDYTTPMHIVVGANEEYYTKSIRITLNTKLDNLSRSGKIVNANESWKVTEIRCDGTPVELAVDPLVHGPNLAEVTVGIPANTTGRARSYAVTLALEAHPECTIVLTVGQEA